MSKQREQKAWAVVDEKGDFVMDLNDPLIVLTEDRANSYLGKGERVVPCLITWREESQ